MMIKWDLIERNQKNKETNIENAEINFEILYNQYWNIHNEKPDWITIVC